VPSLLCFYCKLSQDEVPEHILSMIDNTGNKRQKMDYIKELFVKGKSGSWEMDTTKPIFKQELTYFRGLLYSLALELSNPMSISLSRSLQSYRSQNLMFLFLESYVFILIGSYGKNTSPGK